MRRLHKLLADALGICAALYAGVFHRVEAALDGWFRECQDLCVRDDRPVPP